MREAFGYTVLTRSLRTALAYLRHATLRRGLLGLRDPVVLTRQASLHHRLISWLPPGAFGGCWSTPKMKSKASGVKHSKQRFALSAGTSLNAGGLTARISRPCPGTLTTISVSCRPSIRRTKRSWRERGWPNIARFSRKSLSLSMLRWKSRFLRKSLCTKKSYTQSRCMKSLSMKSRSLRPQCMNGWQRPLQSHRFLSMHHSR